MLEFCFISGTVSSHPKSAYDGTGQRKYLTHSEGQKFVRRAEKLSSPQKLFCLMLFYTGCRISEALALSAIDIDGKAGVLQITTLKKRNRKVVRRVPVPSFLCKELKNLGSKNPQGLIWKFSRVTGWRCVKEVMEAAGIFGIHATCKGLRHGFGVRCALRKIPVTLIQNWMGHSSLSTTAIYLAVRDKEERQLIRRTWV